VFFEIVCNRNVFSTKMRLGCLVETGNFGVYLIFVIIIQKGKTASAPVPEIRISVILTDRTNSRLPVLFQLTFRPVRF